MEFFEPLGIFLTLAGFDQTSFLFLKKIFSQISVEARSYLLEKFANIMLIVLECFFLKELWKGNSMN